MDEDEDDSEEEEEAEDEQGGEEDAPQEDVPRQAGDYKSDAQGAFRTAAPQRSAYETANPEPAAAPTPVTPARTAHARAPATPTRLPSCVPPAVGSLMHTLPLHVLLCRQSPVERSTMRIHRARLMVGCCYACQAGGVGDTRSTLLRLSRCGGAVGMRSGDAFHGPVCDSCARGSPCSAECQAAGEPAWLVNMYLQGVPFASLLIQQGRVEC